MYIQYVIEKPYFLENIASIVINNCSFSLYVYTILKEDGVIHNKYCICKFIRICKEILIL